MFKISNFSLKMPSPIISRLILGCFFFNFLYADINVLMFFLLIKLETVIIFAFLGLNLRPDFFPGSFAVSSSTVENPRCISFSLINFKGTPE